MTAREAQRLAEFIAFGPMVFQTARIMLKWGILELLRNSDSGLTEEDVAAEAGISRYAAKCLLEASLCIGLVLIDDTTDRYTISKTGWFLLNDPATRVNVSFNHDVNYRGLFSLEEALAEGKPAGLDTLGSWPTIYEGLSSLPPHVSKSWFDFDHFYSDGSFPRALEIVFERKPQMLLDVGGNTGRWALECVARDEDVRVCIVDLPQQIRLMESNTAGKPGADRIEGLAADLLASDAPIAPGRSFDAVWMSQFLDCFSESQTAGILRRIRQAIRPSGRLYIMETLWDRQKYEPAAFCLTMTSLYFTAMANGNSKMFHSDDLLRLIGEAGLEVETIHDYIGQGHSIIVCRLPEGETSQQEKK